MPLLHTRSDNTTCPNAKPQNTSGKSIGLKSIVGTQHISGIGREAHFTPTYFLHYLQNRLLER